MKQVKHIECKINEVNKKISLKKISVNNIININSINKDNVIIFYKLKGEK